MAHHRDGALYIVDLFTFAILKPYFALKEM